MRLLITGGRGPVGSAVVESCKADDAVELVVTLGRSEVEEANSQRVHHKVGSILDRELINGIFEEYQVTHLIHAAGARTKDCEENPNLAFEVNTQATSNIFETAARSKSVLAGLFVSTAAVYGKSTKSNIDESHPLASISNYAKSKEEAELGVCNASEKSSLRTVIVRPGFIPASSRSKLWKFGEQIKTNNEVKFRFVERFFIHSVRDVARSLMLLIKGHPQCEGLYHLPGHTVTMTQFVGSLQEIANELGFKPKVSTEVDDTLPLPESLGWKRFKEDFPNIEPQNLKGIVRDMMMGGKAKDQNL